MSTIDGSVALTTLTMRCSKSPPPSCASGAADAWLYSAACWRAVHNLGAKNSTTTAPMRTPNSPISTKPNEVRAWEFIVRILSYKCTQRRRRWPQDGLAAPAYSYSVVLELLPCILRVRGVPKYGLLSG